MRGTLELWDRPEYDSTARQLIAPITEIEAGFENLRITPDSSMEIAVAADADWLSSAAYGQVFWRELDDVRREWRLTEITDTLNTGIVRVAAKPLHTLLRDIDIVRQTTTGGITQWNLGGVGLDADLHIQKAIEDTLDYHGISWIVVGTIDSAVRFDQSFDGQSLLEACLSFRDRVAGEFLFERDEVGSQYTISIYDEINSGAAEVMLSSSRDLFRFVRRRSPRDMVTVAVPRGGTPDGGQDRASIGQASWKISGAIAAGWVPLADRAGGPGPVTIDDLFVEKGTSGDWKTHIPAHYLQKPDGTLEKITDSDEATNAVKLADTTGLAVDDDVMIVADSSGTLMDRIYHPTAFPLYGPVVGRVDRDDLRGERNYVRNPLYSDWSSFRFQRCQKNTTETSTFWQIDGLPASYSIPTGAVLVDGDNPGPYGARVINGPHVANGSGEVTVELHRSITGTDNEELVVIDDHPAGWTNDGTEAQAFLQVDTSNPSMDASGKVDGLQAGVTEVLLKDFPANLAIKRGAAFQRNDGNGGSIVVEDVTLDGSGAGTVKLWNNDTWADNLDIDIRFHDYAAEDVGDYVILLGGSIDTTRVYGASPAIKCAEYTIRATAGLTRLVAEVKYKVAVGDTNETWSPPSMWLADEGAGSILVEQDFAAFDAGVDDNTATYTATIDTTLTANTDLAIYIGGPTGAATQKIYPIIMSVSLGLLPGTGSPVPGEGSQATALFQEALAVIEKQGEWTAEYGGTAQAIGARWLLDPADPVLQPGGTINTIVPELSVSSRLRCASRKADMIKPIDTVALNTVPEGLAQKLTKATAEPPSFVRVEDDSAGTVAAQTVRTRKRPPDVAGAFRSKVGRGKALPATPPAYAALPE